jgi:Domain of unknown function (DUF1330)
VPFGGRLVSFGASIVPLEGIEATTAPAAIVVFPSLQACQDWFASPRYREIAPIWDRPRRHPAPSTQFPSLAALSRRGYAALRRATTHKSTPPQAQKGQAPTRRSIPSTEPRRSPVSSSSHLKENKQTTPAESPAPIPDLNHNLSLTHNLSLRACLRIRISGERVAGALYGSLRYRSLPPLMQYCARSPCYAVDNGLASQRYGPNIHVRRSRAGLPRVEVTLAADPNNSTCRTARRKRAVLRAERARVKGLEGIDSIDPADPSDCCERAELRTVTDEEIARLASRCYS